MRTTRQTIDRPLLGSAIIGGIRIDVFESRTTRWLFDRARKRFLRLPSQTSVDATVLGLRWTPYENLDIKGRDVRVMLDAAGTCRLRAAAA
jgi:hypothetical protein